MNYRSEALRRSAEGQPCVRCGVEDGTTVLAHSNESNHGKGMSIKAHDLLSLFLCSSCHAWFDQGKASREEKRQMFRECYPKQMVRVSELLAAGKLKL
jgi:hypothetical protein